MGNFDRTRWFYTIFKMDVTIWLSVLLAVIALGTPVSSDEPRVVCYYTNWSVYRPGTARFNPQNINPYLCTHLIYAFGGFTKDNTLKPFDKYQDIEKGGYAKFTGLKTYNKNLKTLLAIGGWNEGSSRFSPMVASRDRRKEFVRNAIKFLRQNRFDGLDLDWEYPAFRDGGKPKDRENYAKLVKELREEFEREAEKTGKTRLLLTMAVPAGIEYIQKGFDVKTLNRYLDWMNLLTYDYHSAFEPSVNHHAPLYPLEEPNEYSVDNELNIDYTIKFYLESGADANKLVLGIPTYGRSYTLFNGDAIEIGSPADGPGEQGDATREKGYLAYYEICEALKPKTQTRRQTSDEDSDEDSEEEEEAEEQPWTVMHPNPDAMGPVAYRGNQWVGYDDVDIVKRKAAYVAENGLGGIMFWSIDNDDFRGACHDKQYPLIEAGKEAYYAKLGSSGNVVREKAPTRSSSSRNRPKPTTTTTTEPTTKASKRITSTTPAWNINTPVPPTTPDPGSDFKCTDEGFFPHPRDCKKYFWCLDSGPSNLGIVAHQFTCPSGLYFNKAADSCDFARNVLCKKTEATTKAPTTRAPTTTTTTTTEPTTRITTTRRPLRLSTKNSVLFRTTTTTTTTTTTSAPEIEESPEDAPESAVEDPQVIKELIDLIKKVGGIEQLEKQLHLGEAVVSNENVNTNKKLYQKVLERARGKNKFTGKSVSENSGQNSRGGPQNAGLEASNDRDKLLRRDRPQYTTINRQRGSTTTEEPLSSEESEEVEEEKVEVVQSRPIEPRLNVATTAKPLQYVNIRRGRPNTSDTADDTASRNALFERTEPIVNVDTPNFYDILNSRRENGPEYVTIRRQRPTIEETTTVQYNSEEETDLQETALEREISTQPQYNTIVRSRSTLPPEEPKPETVAPRTRPTTTSTETPNSPEPTTVLDVQISSLLNSFLPEEEAPETEPPATEQAETTTTTTTTTTTRAPSTRRPAIRRRGPTTITTPAPSTTTQAAKRGFLRRTKAPTASPETTEPSTDKTETTTNKFTRRGNSKFKSRKELEKNVEKNEIENGARRPSLNGGSRRNERPVATRKFVSRRRPGGANLTPVNTTTPLSSTTTTPLSSTTRRAFRIASRRRPVSSTTTTVTPTTTTTAATTTLRPSSYEDEESLQEIEDNDFDIEEPTSDQRAVIAKPRRPLLILKNGASDQNPSATNEDENKRQSKKYSASIKQNQLEEIVRKSQEESSTEKKTTTVEDFSPETAVAIAAHKLITAPVPSITDFDEDEVTPTRKSQTTVEYKYTSREYNEYTDTRTPTYDDYQSTPTYAINTVGNEETTAFKTTKDSDFDSTKDSDFDSTKVTDFDVPKTTLNKYPSTPEYKTIDYVRTTSEDSYTDFDSPKISTYDVPKSTNFPNTANTVTNQDFIRTGDYTMSEYEPDISTAYVTKATNKGTEEFTFAEPYYRTTSTDGFDSTLTEANLPKLSTTLSPPPVPKTYERTTTSFVGNSPRTASSFTPRSTEATKPIGSEITANVVTAGYSGVQRGTNRYRTEKLIPVPVEDTGYSTVGTVPSSQEPTYFTREYLLESPVTKTYDENYQYLLPITTPQPPSTTVTRKVIRKKIHRKISTTLAPTTTAPSTTSIKPRRVPSKPFEKVKPKSTYKQIANYDYYDDTAEEKVKYPEGQKVLMHENGVIECLDIGNFPHPSSCKKFISCARIENGSLLGWEYICPKGLSFDPVGGICNWSAGLGCKETDA